MVKITEYLTNSIGSLSLLWEHQVASNQFITFESLQIYAILFRVNAPVFEVPSPIQFCFLVFEEFPLLEVFGRGHVS